MPEFQRRLQVELDEAMHHREEVSVLLYGIKVAHNLSTP